LIDRVRLLDVPKMLILGGTGEAAELVRCLPKNFTPITSWAGRTKAPANLPGEVRIGGFDGADGLKAYLQENRIDVVVDATHPFAARISENAAKACTETGVPRLYFLRSTWEKQPGDEWVFADSLEDAAERVAALGRRPLLTIGRQHLNAFSGLNDVEFLVRVLEKPEAPLPLEVYQTVVGKPPIFLEGEQALFRRHSIDLLITKESGGEATYAKIEAARLEKIPVLMIRRPVPPPGDAVSSVEGALDWLSRLSA